MPSSMFKLTIPNRPQLLKTLGRLAIAHTHLELILRYCVKTLSGSTVMAALDNTEGERISDLRDTIKTLFKQKGASASEKTELQDILNEAKLLSKTRNLDLHRAWSETDAGEAVRKGDASQGHQWEPAPLDEEIERVASNIQALGQRLNHARLHGFIKEVVQRQPPSAQTAP